MISSNRRVLALTLLALATAAACTSAKSFQVNRVSAYGFMKCANSALRTQLRYQVEQPNDSTLIGKRQVGAETGTMTVTVRGMPDSPVVEVVPKNVPNSDRDALLTRCSEWTT